jgi:proteasome accessory factor C
VWALDFIGDRLPLGAEDPLASARAKIEAAIGDGPRPTVEIGRIHTANAEVATAINQAIRDDNVVEIEYWTDSRGAMTNREIEPHLLMNARDAWYVVSHCRTAKDRRTFRLDRIRSAKVRDDHFARRPELSASGQAPWQRDASDESSAGTAVVWCSPKIARWFAEEHPIRATNADGSVVVEIAYASDGWLVKEILKQQADAVLLEPAELRATIAESGARILSAEGPTAKPRTKARAK